MNKKTNRIMAFTVVAVLGIAAMAFAGWGDGYGRMGGMMGYGGGYGPHHMEGYEHGRWGNTLSDEDSAKLDQQQAQFYKETEGLRQQLYQKDLALRSELAKESPDAAAASAIQQDISKFQAQLDQKQLENELQTRKTVPGYGMGYGRHGYGMEYGRCMR
ncbi:MAG: periplasmic heavy metal sensor [Pseudomonadota bacterium]